MKTRTRPLTRNAANLYRRKRMTHDPSVVNARRKLSRSINVGKIDPTRTTTMRAKMASHVKRVFAILRGRILKLVVDEDAFGLVEKSHKLKFNVFCPTGEGGGVDPTCGGASEESKAVETLSKGILAQAKATLDKVPGAKWLREKSKIMYDKLVNRYGKKVAVAVVASGQAISWGAFGLGAAAGIPIWIPSALATAPGAALAELHYRIKGKGKTTENEEEPDPILVTRLAREMVEELEKEWALVQNVFCATGAGGGVDPSCSAGSSSGSVGESGLNQKATEQLNGWMRRMKELAPQGRKKWAYTSVGDLLEKEGVSFKPPTSVPEQIVKGKDFQCYENAYNVMKSDPERYIYVEGIAISSRLGGQRHAWNFDRVTGEVVDSTYGTEGLAYRGVPLDSSFVEERVAENGFGVFLGKGGKWNSEARELLKSGLPSASITPIKNTLVTNAPDRWRFNTTSEQVKAFQLWLRKQMKGLLVSKTEEALWKRYIEDGLRKGAGRAFDDVSKPYAKGYAKDESTKDFYSGSKEQFLRDSFRQPVAKEKVKLLAGRTFDDLVGVTEVMSTQMTRTLTDALVQGKGPREVARDLNKKVDGIGQARALVISRTELIRAHAEGQLTAMELLGVEEVGIAVEWHTSHRYSVDKRGNPLSPCELCIPMEGVILKLSEAHGMIPRHPNCMCSWIPANVGEDQTDQVSDRTGIREAIRESVELSGGMDATTWEGADASISRSRPESILNLSSRLRALIDYESLKINVFCATGQGGGVDASCGADGLGSLPDSKGVERKDMPQLKHGDQEKMVEWMKDKGVKVTYERVLTGDLKPIQKDYDPKKVAIKPESALKKPIIVSRGGRILDGTHHWLKAIAEDHSSVPVIRLHVSWRKALELMHKFPKTFKAALVSNALLLKESEEIVVTLLDGVWALNVFCPTGPGGGVDPSCSAGEGGGVAPISTGVYQKMTAEERTEAGRLEREGTKLGKKIEDGSATEADKARREEVLQKSREMARVARERDTPQSGTSKEETSTSDDPKPLDKERLAVDIVKAGGPYEQRQRLKEIVKENSEWIGTVKVHGMDHEQPMKQLTLDGVKMRYGINCEDSVVEDIRQLVANRDKIPTSLWQATGEITYTAQVCAHNGYWEKQFGIPGFEAAATGGDGGIVVYRADNAHLGLSNYAHEAGHNFAAATYGQTAPMGSYREAQQHEPAVSSYGSNSPAEDFAEAMSLYITKPEELKANFPKKYEALNKLVKDDIL